MPPSVGVTGLMLSIRTSPDVRIEIAEAGDEDSGVNYLTDSRRARNSDASETMSTTRTARFVKVSTAPMR